MDDIDKNYADLKGKNRIFFQFFMFFYIAHLRPYIFGENDKFIPKEGKILNLFILFPY